MMLRRNNCDRVKSCLTQIKSTVASRLLIIETLSMDLIFSMFVLLLVVDYRVYDVVSLNWRSGNKTGRKLDREI